MNTFFLKHEEHIFIAILVLVGTVVCAVVFSIIVSSILRDEEHNSSMKHYARCLEVVLKSGTLNDAETMCGYMRRQ